MRQKGGLEVVHRNALAGVGTMGRTCVACTKRRNDFTKDGVEIEKQFTLEDLDDLVGSNGNADTISEIDRQIGRRFVVVGPGRLAEVQDPHSCRCQLSQQGGMGYVAQGACKRRSNLARWDSVPDKDTGHPVQGSAEVVLGVLLALLVGVEAAGSSTPSGQSSYESLALSSFVQVSAHMDCVRNAREDRKKLFGPSSQEMGCYMYVAGLVGVETPCEGISIQSASSRKEALQNIRSSPV